MLLSVPSLQKDTSPCQKLATAWGCLFPFMMKESTVRASGCQHNAEPLSPHHNHEAAARHVGAAQIALRRNIGHNTRQCKDDAIALFGHQGLNGPSSGGSVFSQRRIPNLKCHQLSCQAIVRWWQHLQAKASEVPDGDGQAQMVKVCQMCKRSQCYEGPNQVPQTPVQAAQVSSRRVNQAQLLVRGPAL